jgi:DNA polymerase-3 subunit alpha
MHRDYPDLKNGRKPISYLHPDMEGILGDTYGLMLYQESVMRVAERFAGFTLAEADNLRKACGKKNRVLIAEQREMFVAGCVAQGFGDKLGTDLFDIIEPFADYAFNKSHSYGYGLVAYQTAWLKANHPVEYMAALLSSVKDDKDRTAVYLAECRSMSVEVLVPDVNLSAAAFTARRNDAPQEPPAGVTPLRDKSSRGPGSIAFGLSAVRNVGGGLVGHIVAERERGGPFSSFYDFCNRVDTTVLNKRTVESLVKAGGFDALGHPRKGLCLVFEEIIDRTITRRREEELGISTLFSLLEQPSPASGDGGSAAGGFDETHVAIPDVEFDKSERLALEKEMLGLYVSDHPLMGLERELRRVADTTIRELVERATAGEGFSGEQQGGGYVTEVQVVGGVVTSLQRRYTKRGELMGTFVLEDLESAIDVFVFPKTMREYGAQLEEDAIVCVRARVDLREEQPKLVAMDIRRPELRRDDVDPPLEVTVPVGALTDTVVQRLRDLLAEHSGPSPVLLRLGPKVLRLPPEFNVDPASGLVGALKELLGAGAVSG